MNMTLVELRHLRELNQKLDAEIKRLSSLAWHQGQQIEESERRIAFLLRRVAELEAQAEWAPGVG